MAQSEHLRHLLKPEVLIDLGVMVRGPVDLLQLKDRVNRIQSSAENSARIELLVQFKTETWEALNQLSNRLKSEGQTATPAELASLLVESGLEATRTEQ